MKELLDLIAEKQPSLYEQVRIRYVANQDDLQELFRTISYNDLNDLLKEKCTYEHFLKRVKEPHLYNRMVIMAQNQAQDLIEEAQRQAEDILYQTYKQAENILRLASQKK